MNKYAHELGRLSYVKSAGPLDMAARALARPLVRRLAMLLPAYGAVGYGTKKGVEYAADKLVQNQKQITDYAANKFQATAQDMVNKNTPVAQDMLNKSIATGAKEYGPYVSQGVSEAGNTLGLGVLGGLAGTGLSRLLMKQPPKPKNNTEAELDKNYAARKSRDNIANLMGILASTAAGGAYAYRDQLKSLFKR